MITSWFDDVVVDEGKYDNDDELNITWSDCGPH